QSCKWIQDACGNGHAKHVIDKSKEKVLADIAHGSAAQVASTHERAKVAFDQRDVAAFHGHIRTCPHGDANICLGKRRRVVHAVAGHSNDATFSLKLFDDSKFLL